MRGKKRSCADPKMHSGSTMRDVDGRRDSRKGGVEREGKGQKREEIETRR